MAGCPVITIDGPGGAGKGTMARRLASHLGWHYLDSGALYRLLALRLQKAGAGEDRAARLATDLPVRFALDSNEVWLDDEPVADRIRNEDIGALASAIAVREDVRAALLSRQRDFAQPPGLVADGRDMGTVVFSEAPLKIFLDANAEVRAGRRERELRDQGKDVSFEKIFREICERDERDRNRDVAPLVPAAGAVIVDTSSLTPDQVFDELIALVRKHDLASG